MKFSFLTLFVASVALAGLLYCTPPPPSANWTPLSDSTHCKFWFDMSDTTTMSPSSPITGTLISQLNDKCPSALNATQGDSSVQMTYTTGVLNGRGGLLSAYKAMAFGTTGMINSGQPYAIYAVVQPLVLTSLNIMFGVFDESGTDDYFGYLNGSGSLFRSQGSFNLSYNAAVTLTNSGSYLLEWLYSGSGAGTLGNYSAFNGTSSLSLSSAGNDSGATAAIGSYTSGGAGGAGVTFNGYFLEMFEMTTTTTQSQATSYLKTKWGL
jgi:hypothetical protein